MKYRVDIDGLRAVAVLMVLLYHFDLLGITGGFLGVDVFFVISGFLITSIVYGEIEREKFKLSNFYVKRIRRLAPALVVTMGLTLLVGYVVLLPGEFTELAEQVAASQFYLANFYYWLNIDYFGLQAESVYLLHTWSLAVEEQFYLVYPLLLLFFFRRHFWFWIFGGMLASLLLSLWVSHVDSQTAFYMLPTRAWQLLAGALCIPLIHSLRNSRRVAEIAGWVGLLLITASALVYRDGMSVPGTIALLPVLGAVCVVVSGGVTETKSGAILRHPISVYFGKISYPLYLVHWPVNVFGALLLADTYTLTARIIMFLFSILLADAIYRFVEVPLRNRLQILPGRSTLQPYVLVLLLTLVVFHVIERWNGLPGRFSEEVLEISRYASDKTPSVTDCLYDPDKPIDSQFCRIGVSDRQPTWLVYGDSHAWAGKSAFDLWLKDKAESGLFLFRHSCLPLMGIHLLGDRGVCDSFSRNTIAGLEGQPSIRNVLIVSTWHQPLEGILTDETGAMLTDAEAIRLFQRALTTTLETLNAMGRKVSVWEPVPGAHHNVPLTMARAMVFSREVDLSIPYEEYTQTYDFFFEALRLNASLIDQRYAPSRLLCNGEECAPTINERPAYFDNSHLARSHAPVWARAMRTMEAEQQAKAR